MYTWIAATTATSSVATSLHGLLLLVEIDAAEPCDRRQHRQDAPGEQGDHGSHCGRNEAIGASAPPTGG